MSDFEILSSYMPHIKEELSASYNRNSSFEQVDLGEIFLNQIKPADISTQELLRKMCESYGTNQWHSERLLSYLNKGYFCPSSPVLASVPWEGGIFYGSPISCFLSEVDNNKNVRDIMHETMYYAKLGGGLGTTWDTFPSSYETDTMSNKGSLGIAFSLKVQAELMKLACGRARKVGSLAGYLSVRHCEIENFIDMRKSSGDPDSMVPRYVNHGIIIPDEFMRCVVNNENWDLCTLDGKVVKTVKSRDLLLKIITTRMETGEPYLFFIDNANKTIKDYQKNLGLSVKTSNLCTEITLATGKDIFGQYRTAICNLCSLNLLFFDQWKNNSLFFKDILEFMDNILSYFIVKVPEFEIGDKITNLGTVHEWLKQEEESVQKALHKNHPSKYSIYSAFRERSIGIGVMGLTSYFQNKGVAFESAEARRLNEEIFATIKEELDRSEIHLIDERGECPDSRDGKGRVKHRFSNKTAIAPTVTIANIVRFFLGKRNEPLFITPCIEPTENVSLHKGQKGFRVIKNEFLDCYMKHYLSHLDTDNLWKIIAETRTCKSLVPSEIFEIFKTPFEIKQDTIVNMAITRQKYIDQAQSLNFFWHNNELVKNIIKTVIDAWQGGVKTFYYHRSDEGFQASETF